MPDKTAAIGATATVSTKPTDKTRTPRQARVRWVVITLAALVGIGVTASLGQWQLGRAAQKIAYQQQLDERAAMPALTAADLQRLPSDVFSLQYRQVELRGEWLPAQTVYLDNRQMQGRPGFYVLTPLRVTAAAADSPANVLTVLVQRGWVARNFQDRAALPVVDSPAGAVLVQGRLAGQPPRLLELQSTAAEQGASQIRQNWDTDSAARALSQPVVPLTVVQTGAGSDGLLRDWSVVGSGVEKHYGYAFQWFGLCSLIAILYAWFQIVQRVFRRRRHPSPTASG